jgi:hypothetical protein
MLYRRTPNYDPFPLRAHKSGDNWKTPKWAKIRCWNVRNIYTSQTTWKGKQYSLPSSFIASSSRINTVAWGQSYGVMRRRSRAGNGSWEYNFSLWESKRIIFYRGRRKGWVWNKITKLPWVQDKMRQILSGTRSGESKSGRRCSGRSLIW